jgi:2-polyprenyl-6-methoxyphenol hydroxylase-like FAD-dependent oxidoreductase
MSTTLTTNGPDTDVLIVGAGPTGLALATMLIRSGISHVIVDKLATGQNTSRAAVIHAHTLEVLEQLGVSERLAHKGLKLARFSIRDRDRVLVQLRFDTLPTRHPYLLMLPQDMTERILAEGLAEAGGAVRRGCTVEALVETPEGIQASVVSDEGRQTIHARYVVGADGMHSLVRQTAGIEFVGAGYEESFVLADVEMTWGHGRDEVMLFFSPAGLVVVAPLPTGAYRIVATLDNAPEIPDIADVQTLLDMRGPTEGVGKVSKVLWGSRFRLHHRLADQYRRGRFLLIGDAAHVHSPAGGQGMNTGLVDACVLGRILADVVSGRRNESHLDIYEQLRRPAAEQVLQLAGRLTHMATMKSAPQRFLRNIALGMVNLLPIARQRLEMDLSGLSRRAAAELHEGHRGFSSLSGKARP